MARPLKKVPETVSRFMKLPQSERAIIMQRMKSNDFSRLDKSYKKLAKSMVDAANKRIKRFQQSNYKDSKPIDVATASKISLRSDMTRAERNTSLDTAYNIYNQTHEKAFQTTARKYGIDVSKWSTQQKAKFYEALNKTIELHPEVLASPYGSDQVSQMIYDISDGQISADDITSKIDSILSGIEGERDRYDLSDTEQFEEDLKRGHFRNLGSSEKFSIDENDKEDFLF